MRIFLIGDYTSGTGPANATRSLLSALPSETLRLKTWNKITRTFEILYKTKKADVCLFSGYSRQNIVGLKWAKLLRRPSAYLMHGCVEYENAINGVPDENMNRVERETLRLSDLILGVSEPFTEWLRQQYPMYRDKIKTLTNGIDWKLLEDCDGDSDIVREENRILSVGGGMPRKRIVKICEAVRILNEKGYHLILSVAGAEGNDTPRINEYPFVENRRMLGRKEMNELYHSAKIFIQNSCFETFGLAPLEALLSGCDLLLSKQVGALSVLSGIREDDVITDCENPEEIAEKIELLLKRENHTRLLVELDKESTSWEARALELQDILNQRKEKKS